MKRQVLGLFLCACSTLFFISGFSPRHSIICGQLFWHKGHLSAYNVFYIILHSIVYSILYSFSLWLSKACEERFFHESLNDKCCELWEKVARNCLKVSSAFYCIHSCVLHLAMCANLKLFSSFSLASTGLRHWLSFLGWVSLGVQCEKEWMVLI